MFSRITKAGVVTVLAAALAFAQGGPRRMGPGGGTPPDPATMVKMHVEMLAVQLNLTDDQKARATTICTDAHTAVQGIQTSMQTAREALAAAVKKNDVAAIDQAAAAIGTATAQLTAINGKADAAFYAILTADQQAQADKMPPRGGGPGRGMMMGPQGFGRGPGVVR